MKKIRKLRNGSSVYIDIYFMLNMMDKNRYVVPRHTKEDYLEFLSGSPLHTSNIVALEASDDMALKNYNDEVRQGVYNDFIAEHKPAVSETIYFDIPAYSDMIQKIYDILGDKDKYENKYNERKMENAIVSSVKDIVHSGTNGLSESKVAIDRKLETINIMNKLFIHPTNFLLGLQLLHCKEEPGINTICVSDSELFQFKAEFGGKVRCYCMGYYDFRNSYKKIDMGLYLITRIRYTSISDAEISEILFDMKYETTFLNLEKRRYTLDDIYLVRAWLDCYYALLTSNGRSIGFLKLKRDSFTVHFTNEDGEIIYENNTKGYYKFKNNERKYYLDNAKQALVDKLNGEPISVKSSRGKSIDEMLYFAIQMESSNSDEELKKAIQEYKDYVNFKDKDAPADEDNATPESL